MYEWLIFAYPNKMATLEQCRLAVEMKKITEAQFKEITGEDYFKQNTDAGKTSPKRNIFKFFTK